MTFHAVGMYSIYLISHFRLGVIERGAHKYLNLVYTSYYM